MDEVYRKRQLQEGGSDPFQDARVPEGDPALSAAGEGKGDAEAAERSRELREEKHREFHDRVRPPTRAPHDDRDEA